MEQSTISYTGIPRHVPGKQWIMTEVPVIQVGSWVEILVPGFSLAKLQLL